MTMAETSAPASGGEHLISHSLDMMSSIDGQPHDLHGRQVGIGTILAAACVFGGAALEAHIAAHRRLTHPGEMGTLFKALGLVPRGAPMLPGLDP